MKLEILQVTDCPNVAVLEQRLRRAIAGTGIEIDIVHRVIDDVDQAAEAGMTGSPTLLVEGRDPFAVPGQLASVSCRLYRTSGGIEGAPSVAALRQALASTTPVSEDADEPAPACCAARPGNRPSSP